MREVWAAKWTMVGDDLRQHEVDAVSVVREEADLLVDVAVRIRPPAEQESRILPAEAFPKLPGVRYAAGDSVLRIPA